MSYTPCNNKLILLTFFRATVINSLYFWFCRVGFCFNSCWLTCSSFWLHSWGTQSWLNRHICFTRFVAALHVWHSENEKETNLLSAYYYYYYFIFFYVQFIYLFASCLVCKTSFQAFRVRVLALCCVVQSSSRSVNRMGVVEFDRHFLCIVYWMGVSALTSMPFREEAVLVFFMLGIDEPLI